MLFRFILSTRVIGLTCHHHRLPLLLPPLLPPRCGSTACSCISGAKICGKASHQALAESGINTFMDERLAKGRESSELHDRIRKSRALVVIFSENFASSRWCLDELVKILKCRERLGQEVLPIFYKVPLSELRELRGKTGEHLAKHRDVSDVSPEKVEQWRLAVKHFADLKGWHFTQGESKLVTKIVKTSRANWSRDSLSRRHLIKSLFESISPHDPKKPLDTKSLFKWMGPRHDLQFQNP